jgi:hypothetical protein
MAENKTKPTGSSVESYLAGIADEGRRRDCQALAKLMSKVTKEKPAMWGPSIVGFGSYHYRYDSGREGDAPIVAFASRKNEIVLYLSTDAPRREALLARLGRHKTAKGCLYVRRLDDVDPSVLEQLVAGAFAARGKERA